MTKEIYLIRHTTPDIDKGICYGQLDLDVSLSFNDELTDIKHLLNNFEPEMVYSSPLKRCMFLAQHLFPQNETIADSRLMEMNFGDWEGQKWLDIPRNGIDQWSNDFLDVRTPNGESFQNLIDRAEQFASGIQHTEPSKMAVITHSGIIRCFLMKYLNIPHQNIFNLNLNYGCIIRIRQHTPDYNQVEFIKG